MKVVRNAQGYAIAYGPNDDNYVPEIPQGCSLHIEDNPDLTPPPPTAAQSLEVKKQLLATGIDKRDRLLDHLRWFYTKAKEERDVAVGETEIDAANAKLAAIMNSIDSLQNIFNDPRVVAAVNGDVKTVVITIYLEIFFALQLASPETYNALIALDPL